MDNCGFHIYIFAQMKMKDKKKDIIYITILIFVLLLAFALRYYFNPMDIEDAPITYRYAKNIAEGNGFVYNSGERVLGTTTPLYTIILAFFNYVGFDLFFISNLIGLFSALASCILIYLIFKDNNQPKIGLLAAFFLAILNDFVIYTMNGMETSFYVMLILLSFYLYQKKKYVLTSIALALVSLTRPDGLILALVIFLHYIWTKKQIPWKLITIFILLLLPWVIFSVYRFGSPLPNSLAAKQLHVKIEPFFLRTLGFFYDRSYLILMPFLLIGTIFLIKKKEKKLYPLLLWAILYIIAYTIVNVDAYAWYFIPLVPVFIGISSYGILYISNILKRALKNRIISKIFVLVLCLIILSTSILGTYHYINKVDSNWRNYKYIGLWLKNNTKEDSTIMLGAIGYIGYYSERKIIDSAFLITKIPTKDKVTYYEAVNELYLKYKPDYFIEKDFNDIGQEIKFVNSDYILIKNFTMVRNYRTEDLRFSVNYNDNWLIYKRKDLK